MPRASAFPGLAFAALLAACSFPDAVKRIDEESPREDLGRSSWVRGSATAGAWLGGVVGAVASIPFLIVTWPLDLLAADELGKSREEFVWAPVSVGAATGHFLIGAPFDALDWIFHRAWTSDATDEPVEPVPLDDAAGNRENGS